jgi:hypothetical protein
LAAVERETGFVPPNSKASIRTKILGDCWAVDA